MGIKGKNDRMVVLACEECKERNYTTTKNKKNIKVTSRVKQKNRKITARVKQIQKYGKITARGMQKHQGYTKGKKG